MRIVLKDNSLLVSLFSVVLIGLYAFGVSTSNHILDDNFRVLALLIIVMLFYIVYTKKSPQRVFLTKLSTIILLFILALYSYSINYYILFFALILTSYWIGRFFQIILLKKYDENLNEILY
ncbi:hypothetical protein CPU12_04200 [Malaciobacter molluscorum LMG 25693]|uniref:Membrane protein n=1 Tax=Malaciobacter molluscorum LMG 25693 TaxID=870501 RepID=A0A2G1DJV4_9BACT|nr:hypothetical protein [Malaciobacter molluscorum]AXX92939.1 putative membrane protein [Malaciobacter molluscorum LMG 25693]PHO18769.1 hypothetical protein CPU12_04200 [Malaciobacter molluscorum LMG 25693]RXJ96246.1 hypothetical protein CRV00_03460 [Malaciobacter molluscorum]